MKKPKLCVEPEETQDEYCMTDADLGNLTNLLQQANDICDYYQDMIQNRLGLLCVANMEAHDELIAQVESFRDTVFGMRRIQKSEESAPSARNLTVFYLGFDRDRLFYACYNYCVKSEQQRADGRKPGPALFVPC